MRAVKKVGVATAVTLTAIITFLTIDIYRFSLRDETRPADAAIVLGAAVFGDQPSPVLRERLNHAIQLYDEGIVSILIFTGGHDGLCFAHANDTLSINAYSERISGARSLVS